MGRALRFVAWGAWLGFVACGVNASRTPLGGTYAAPDSAVANDRHAPVTPLAKAPEVAAVEEGKEPVASQVASAQVDAGRPAEVASKATLRYDPFKPGDHIRAQVSLSASAEMRGGPPSMGNLTMDTELLVELKVLKTSSQSLDQLELTLTTQGMHAEFAGHSTDSKQQPPDTYEVTLSGSSPTIRPKNGAKLDEEQRAVLNVLLTPIVEFHTHWARSPALELNSGWSSSVPIAVPSFASAGSHSVRIGPLLTRYNGGQGAGAEAPFALTLPVHYKTDLGELDSELTGSARLSAKTARPTAVDLSGPMRARGGPPGMAMDFTGKLKFSATLSYP